MCTIIILKPLTSIGSNFRNNLISATHLGPSFDHNQAALFLHRSDRKERNATIFDENYAKAPVELLDPKFGIMNYDKKDTNNSRERESAWIAAIDRMRNIDMDAEKYANVFSKAFASGYSAALIDRVPLQRNNNANSNTITNASTEVTKEKVRKVDKDNKMNNSTLPGGYAAGYATARNKMQTGAKKKVTKTAGNLPFNITSDAVGYGAAYASGYALAAADKAARTGNYNNSNLKPWKMNNAAAAGYAAYYAAAIAQTRAVRHPEKNLDALPDSGEKIVEGNQDSRKLINENTLEIEPAVYRERKDLVFNENEMINNNRNVNLSRKNTDESIISKGGDILPLNSNQNASKYSRILREEPRSMLDYRELNKNGIKKERNVQVYDSPEARDGTIQDLILNIEQNPMGGKGTIKDSSLTQKETGLGQDEADENISANLIIQDGGDKNNIANNNNEDLTLDIDPTSLDNKRYISINNNTIHLEDDTNFPLGIDQGLSSSRGRRQFLKETENALIEPNADHLVRVMVNPSLHKYAKRKCGKHKRKKKKKKKVKSIINCGSL